MKTITLIFFLITYCAPAYTQTAPPIQWQRPSGGTAEDNLARGWLCSDGSSVMCGQTTSVDWDITGNHGGYDGWVIKLDASGNKQWQKCYGGSSSDGIFDIKQTSDNGFIMAGYTSSTNGDVIGNHGESDGWVLKTDNTGTIQWKKCIGGTKTDVFDGLNICSDNGYILTGRTNSTDGDLNNNNNKGLLDGWIVKLDAAGNIQWSKNYGGSAEEYIMDIVQLNDNNYVFTGFSESANGDLTGNYGGRDAWFGKVDAANGNLLWSYQYGGSDDDASFSLCKATDGSGNLVAAGYTISPNDYNITGNHGGVDGLLLTLNEVSGVLTEAKCFGGSNDDYFSSVKNTFDKGYILAASSSSNNGDIAYNADIVNGQVWVVKLNNGHTIDFEKTYGSPYSEDGYTAFERPDGGYFVAGDTFGNGGDVSGYHGSTQRDYWAIRLSPCFDVPVSAATITTLTPACGQTVTLSMPGGPQYYYYWYKDFAEIPGANALTYTATQNGTYSSAVVNGQCILSRLSPNSIISQKQKATLSPSGTVNKCAADRLTFTANTGADLTYKWYRNNKEIAGETGSTYKTKKDGKYYVLVTNTATQCEQKSDKTTVNNTCKIDDAVLFTDKTKDTGEEEIIILSQNTPNPFKSVTIISYSIPVGFKKAQIIITDQVGKTIKQFAIVNTGKGFITIDANTMAAGVYSYSLNIDGRILGSKKMMVIK